ncbi:uncharacterized protein trim25l isoform X2 [Cynoglossus semilaevis]|uniref:uncharacterized protein trim25l isoform X2 n=1 Tax=Cynoglossus semilaevis TaxID=244447 RepID=UPI0004963AB9|nr:uncharacterized protein LOC103389779 isoform X2 [Cynoglossus semilaevis]
MSGKLWTEEQFNCPVCLDLPNDPVTIPCGHSYCMGCIKDYWSKDDPKGIYSCPQCRQTFCPKPNLSRNTMLAEAVEQLRKSEQTRRGSTMSTMSSKSRGKLNSSQVPCDLCKGEQRVAVKSCLVCMSSYCETHLKPHQTKKSLKQHELIAPTWNLAEKICTQHKYLQEFFCRQCKMFICWLCTSNLHKGHECVSTKAERMEKQKVVSELQMKNQQRLKDREQELKEMKKMMDWMMRSTDQVHDDLEGALTELQHSVKRLQELLEQVLEKVGEEKMAQAQEVTESLEAEIRELKKREVEMKDLVRCEDHIYYLQAYESMCSPLESGELPPVVVNQEASFEPVRESVLDLRERVEDLCNLELDKITKQVHNTTLFTLMNTNRGSGTKTGISKLFSGLGSRSSSPRTVSAGVKSLDVRSRETPRDRGNNDSPRRGVTHRDSAAPSGRDVNFRSSPTPSREESQSLWNRSSQNQIQVQNQNQSQEPSPTPSRRESRSLWSRASQNQIPNPNENQNQPSPTPSRRESRSLWSRSSQNQINSSPSQTPQPAPASGFSRMASISSIFRSARRGATAATPIGTSLNEAPVGGNPWLETLPEAQTEVNPGLFLDSPSPDINNQTPAFPALREININSIQAPEPRTREEFLQYSVILTLDPNTAHRRLILSEGNTKATLQGAVQLYPDTPQRFDGWMQVMCQNPLSAQRCYWEVEWRGRGSSMGLAYGALCRKGSDARSGLGYNCQSWTLELSDTCCSAMHDNQKKDIPVTYSPRLGVYLDLNAGTLAFYSVAENMTHLHTFRANFTQPVYAAFGVGSGVGVGLDFALGQFTSSSDSIKICPM